MLTKRLDLNDVKLLAYAGVVALGLVGTVNSLLNPVAPAPKPTMTSSAAGPVERLRLAIVGQESGGNHKAENHSGSGAMGMGQVMPENLPSWSKAALGREISKQEFLNDPKLQIKIIDFKLKEYWEASLKQANGNEDEAVRRVAAWWYSGNPNKFDNTRPQRWGKDSYPSIATYTQDVLSRWKQTAQAPVKPVAASAPASSIQIQPGQDPCLALKPAFVSIYTGEEIGSGSVIRSDGLVVTNHHVIKEAQKGAKIHLNFLNSQRYTGRLIASNPARDLALVQIDHQGTFPSIPLTIQKPQVGNKLCAIGIPLGEFGTINHGVFKGWRKGPDLKTYIALRPGNSGGPLINTSGQLVGVNKSVWLDANGRNTNMSFASSTQDVLNLAKSKGIDLNE